MNRSKQEGTMSSTAVDVKDVYALLQQIQQTQNKVEESVNALNENVRKICRHVEQLQTRFLNLDVTSASRIAQLQDQTRNVEQTADKDIENTKSPEDLTSSSANGVCDEQNCQSGEVASAGQGIDEQQQPPVLMASPTIASDTANSEPRHDESNVAELSNDRVKISKSNDQTVRPDHSQTPQPQQETPPSMELSNDAHSSATKLPVSDTDVNKERAAVNGVSVKFNSSSVHFQKRQDGSMYDGRIECLVVFDHIKQTAITLALFTIENVLFTTKVVKDMVVQVVKEGAIVDSFIVDLNRYMYKVWFKVGAKHKMEELMQAFVEGGAIIREIKRYQPLHPFPLDPMDKKRQIERRPWSGFLYHDPSTWAPYYQVMQSEFEPFRRQTEEHKNKSTSNTQGISKPADIYQQPPKMMNTVPNGVAIAELASDLAGTPVATTEKIDSNNEPTNETSEQPTITREKTAASPVIESVATSAKSTEHAVKSVEILSDELFITPAEIDDNHETVPSILGAEQKRQVSAGSLSDRNSNGITSRMESVLPNSSTRDGDLDSASAAPKKQSTQTTPKMHGASKGLTSWGRDYVSSVLTSPISRLTASAVAQAENAREQWVTDRSKLRNSYRTRFSPFSSRPSAMEHVLFIDRNKPIVQIRNSETNKWEALPPLAFIKISRFGETICISAEFVKPEYPNGLLAFSHQLLPGMVAYHDGVAQNRATWDAVDHIHNDEKITTFAYIPQDIVKCFDFTRTFSNEEANLKQGDEQHTFWNYLSLF